MSVRAAAHLIIYLLQRCLLRLCESHCTANTGRQSWKASAIRKCAHSGNTACMISPVPRSALPAPGTNTVVAKFPSWCANFRRSVALVALAIPGAAAFGALLPRFSRARFDGLRQSKCSGQSRAHTPNHAHIAQAYIFFQQVSSSPNAVVTLLCSCC